MCHVAGPIWHLKTGTNLKGQNETFETLWTKMKVISNMGQK